MVKVRAISMGYYEGVKEAGDEFYLDENSYPQLPYWVELVGDVSATGSTVVENSPAPLKETAASVATVKVRAISMGYDGTVREVGDVFDFTLPFWVELVDAPATVEPTPAPRKRKAIQQLEPASPETVEYQIASAGGEKSADAIEPQTETQAEPNIEAELSA